MVKTTSLCKVFLWAWNINFSANNESGGINTGCKTSIGPLHIGPLNSFYISLLILNFSVSFTLCCSCLIQNFFWCSVSSVLSGPLRLVFWHVLRNLLIQAVILENSYNSCFSNKLSNVSDFSIVVVIISLMALHSTWNSVIGPMVGWPCDNEMSESQVRLFQQRSPNLLIGLPRLPMSAGFWFVRTYFHLWINDSRSF